MASQKIGIDIEVSDNNSTAKLVKSVEQLNSLLKQTQKTAASINTGGTQGSRVAAASAGGGAMSGQQYGNLRGAAGVTGASARDFAQEAQGMGGLVRLYATYAANIFAVSAAFRALSDAMNTENMIKGLNALGAATGQNLGGMAKRITEITDGAISLKESMTAVAQGSAAGISSKNMERMAMVAKNASLALGVSMTDALSRLSRGVTKLEPELLDELGIMTKIGPAVDTYARSVGKSASQLTDFERRQAFANAVLTEGEAKFKELADAAASPYDKLLANLKNISFDMLSLVNVALKPLIKLLSENPGILLAAIAAIGTSLVKSAIPALGQFKQGLESSANIAKQVAKDRASDAVKAQDQLNKVVLDRAELNAVKQIDAVDAAEKKIQALQKGTVDKKSAAYQILQKDTADITAQELRRIESSAKMLDTKGLTKQAAAYREITEAIRGSQKAEQDLDNIKKLQQAALDKEKASKFSIYGITMRNAIDAENESVKKNIVSNAAYNGSLIGIKNAWALANQEIAKSGKGLSGLELAALKARVGVAAAAGAMATLGVAISEALNIIGILVTIFILLDTTFAGNKKQADEFNKSIQGITDSVENAGRALDYIDKKGGFAASTIQGITAMSNALTDLTDNAEASLKASIENTKALTVWSGSLDILKEAAKFVVSPFVEINWDIKSNFTDALSKDISESLKVLEKSGLGPEAESAFRSILNVSDLSNKSIKESLNKLATGPEFEEVIGKLKAFTAQANESASNLASFKIATEATTKSYQEFIQSTADNNPLFKMGTSLESLAKSMNMLKSDGIDEVNAAMLEFAKAPEKAILFGDKFVMQLADIKDGYLEQAAAVGTYNNALKETNALLAQTNDPKKIQELTGGKKLLEEQINLLPKDKIEAAKNLFASGISTAFKEADRLIQVGLGQAAEKAGLTIAKAQLAGLSGEGRARKEDQIAQQEIAIQLRAIDTNLNLILGQQRLTAALEEQTAQYALSTAKAEGKLSSKEIDKLEAALLTTQTFRKMLGATGASAPKFGNIGDLPLELQGKVLGVKSAIAPTQAARKLAEGAAGAQKISGAIGIAGGITADSQKVLADEAQALQLKQAQLSTAQAISAVTTREGILKQDSLEKDILANKQATELIGINNAINNAQDDTEKSKQEGYRTTLLTRQEEERRNQALKTTQSLLAVELTKIAQRFDLEKSAADLENIVKVSQIDLATAQVAAYSTLYDITAAYAIKQTAVLETERAIQENTKAKLDAQLAYDKIANEAAQRLALTNDPAAAKEITDNLLLQSTITNNTIMGLQTQLDLKLKTLDITKETALQQDKYNQLTATSVTLAESLGTVFGTVGEALGGINKSFVDFAINADKGAKALTVIETSIRNAEDAGKSTKDLEKDKADQIKKNQKSEITGYAQIAGSAKKMFAEKTFAYKALDKVEKAMHFARLAMDIEEMISKVTALTVGTAATATATATDTAIVNAGFMARIPAYIGGIFGTIVGQIGIPGIAVAAGLTAALFGAFGGGGGSTPFVPTAEQRQETQGTAMSYNGEGAKVQTRAGVFGDTGAKSESIAKSLEVIKANSVVGLSYDNKMLDALNKVADALVGTAKAVYRIPGIATGSLTGTNEGTNTSGGLLGISGLFGKSTTQNIIDSGIKLSGTFKDLAAGAEGTVSAFETISTTVTKSGFFGIGSSTKTSVGTNVVGVPKAAQDAITSAFAYGEQLLNSIGELANIGKDTISTALSNVKVDELASLRGLTGEAFSTQLSAVIGAVFDDAANAIFGQFAQYAKFGEGMLETVVRVTDTNKKINQALENIGTKTANLKGAFEVTEALTNAAGGLQNFVDQNTFFTTNFLTDAERLVPVQKAVTKQMNDLGYGSITTRDGFKKLVQSLDLTTEGGQKTYQALMNVQDGFTQVYAASTKTADAEAALKIVYDNRKKELEDLVSGFTAVSATLKDLKQSLLQGSDSILTPAQKYALAKRDFTDTLKLTKADDPKVRLAALQKLSQTSKDFLAVSKVAYGSSIKYTEDFNTVLNALDLAGVSADKGVDTATKQLNDLDLMVGSLMALEKAASTSTDIQQAIKDFFETKFSDSLQYSLAKSQVTTAYSGVGKTGTQIDTEGFNYWISQLMTGALTSDSFNSVFAEAAKQANMQAMVTSAYAGIGKTGDQIDSEGFNYWLQQLTSGALTSDSFNSVFSGTAKAVRGYAVGGLASGLAMVGEQGPELVDFDSPGRVYNARDTNLMFGNQTNQELVAEIRSLRQEVCDLRKDQNQQTGAIINSNYDANQRAADVVTTAVTQTAQQADWTLKLQPAIV